MMGSLGLFMRVLAALGLTTSAYPQAEPEFNHMVVLGDSLSDMGNAGRFSNGPVWVEQLASQLRLELRSSQTGGLNFAVGGAQLDPRSGPYNLRAQADRFLGRRSQPSQRTLYVIFGGGNDLLATLGHADAPKKVETAVASLRSIIADLVEQGARHLLVPNLPDIGITPAIRARGDNAVAEAGRLTAQFNAAVERALAEFPSPASPDVRLYRLDVQSMAERVRRDPASFGFKNVTAPCGGLPSCEGHLFWDQIHPTTQAHTHLAEAAFRMVSLQRKR
jgi:phospholipase/lecithinase/hemolysin